MHWKHEKIIKKLPKHMREAIRRTHQGLDEESREIHIKMIEDALRGKQPEIVNVSI